MAFGQRTHARGKGDTTRVMQNARGQFLLTMPRSVANWVGIRKGDLLKWSSGGEKRIFLEVVKE